MAPSSMDDPENGLGLQPSLEVPAQTPSTTQEKTISLKALATLLTPVRMAGMMVKTVLICRVPVCKDSRAQRAGGCGGRSSPNTNSYSPGHLSHNRSVKNVPEKG